MDGQSKRTIEILEDMLRDCVIGFGGSWDKFLSLAKFTYNNNYQSSIQMALYEALVGWFEPGEARLLGTDLVQDALDKVKLIQEWLHTALYGQKSYADRKVCDVAYMVGSIFHVSMLRKYVSDPSHTLDFSTVQLDGDLTYDVVSVAILDQHV
ncbi:uncharacterized protein [Nicotiana sylvestris]|uniref:uncharacterized protein n=1 Tax=Nicotiana sylvestris TaxID=4096 RepID=UPI00388CB113